MSQGVLSSTFASLQVRNYRCFFVGQGISQIGNWMTTVALSLFVIQLGGRGLEVGALVACQFLPVLLIGAWAGLFADRTDKLRLLLVVQCFAMVQSFGLAALAFMPAPPMWLLFALAIWGGVATAFDNPARRSFVVELVDPSRMNNAVSLNSAMMTGSRVIGPAVAGGVISLFGYGWCFLIDGVSYVAVMIGYSMIRRSELRPPPLVQRAKGQIRAGFAYIRATDELRVPLVMMAIVGTFAYNFAVVLPLLITQTFHAAESMFTVLFSVISVGSLAGALAVARRREVRLRRVVVMCAAFGVTLVGLALAPGIPSALAVGLLVGLASSGLMTATTAIVQIQAEPSMRGRVVAVQTMVFLGSTPIGGPLLGLICDAWGARVGVAVGAVSAFVAAGYGIASTRGAAGRRAAG